MAEIRPGSWARGLAAAEIRDPRVAALWVVERCLRLKKPADLLRADAERRLDERDRSLLYRLTTDVLRWLVRLDDVIEQVGGRPMAQIDERLLGPLRLGAVQLLFLARVPAHAAVSTSVDLAAARSRPGARFVNALLRKIAASGGLGDFPVERRDPIERLAVETSHGRFLVERWVDRFGFERARSALQANNADRPASLVVTTGAASRDAVVQQLADLGLDVRPSLLSPLGVLIDAGSPLDTPLFRQGAIHPQDEASQCAGLIPLPMAGERVFDAAASPGGKTLSLLSWQPAVRVIAADGSVERLGRLLENRRRTGASFAVLAADARRAAVIGGFDRVIADLPCSGSGTIRKHPELKWRINAEEISRLTREAIAMLDGLAPLVATAGRLVVATCSLEHEENEGQVDAFLARHPGFAPAALEGTLLPEMDRGIDGPGRWRILPGEDHDGFTVHVLNRRL